MNICKSFILFFSFFLVHVKSNAMYHKYLPQAIIESVWIGDTKIIASYMQEHIDAIFKKDEYGKTLLHWALIKEKYEIIDLILLQTDIRKSLCIRDNKGKTPLFYALLECRAGVADRIIKLMD